MLVALPPGTDGPPTAGELASPDLVSPSRLKCIQELREELSCAICLDVCQFPCTTACGHNFCRGCLKSALDVDWQRRCPKCRVPLPHRGQELAVNTTLWNTIQLLFPGQRGAVQAVPEVASGSQRSSQPLPDRAAGGSAAGEQELRRAAPRSQLPPAIARAYTELDDLLAALSLSSSAALARQPPPAVQPAQGNVAAQRPWARPGSAGNSAATQPAQPAADPSVRPANPFARSGAAAGSQRGRPASRSASASSSRNASPDMAAAGQRERAHAGDNDSMLESTAGQLLRAGSPGEEGSQLEVPPTPPTPGALPLHSTAPAALPAPRQQQLSVSLPAGREAEPLGEDGEEDSDITPPAQIVPMHSENPMLPAAPIRRKTAISRLLPSPSPSPTVLAPTAPVAARVS